MANRMNFTVEPIVVTALLVCSCYVPCHLQRMYCVSIFIHKTKPWTVPAIWGQTNIPGLFKPALMTLPRLNVLISEGLGKDTRMQLKLPPPGATSGQALQWCRKKISNILVVPCVYKIGLTADPMLRFYKEPTNSAPSCGHFLCHEKFTKICTYCILPLVGRRPPLWRLCWSSPIKGNLGTGMPAQEGRADKCTMDHFSLILSSNLRCLPEKMMRASVKKVSCQVFSA